MQRTSTRRGEIWLSLLAGIGAVVVALGVYLHYRKHEAPAPVDNTPVVEKPEPVAPHDKLYFLVGRDHESAPWRMLESIDALHTWGESKMPGPPPSGSIQFARNLRGELFTLCLVDEAVWLVGHTGLTNSWSRKNATPIAHNPAGDYRLGFYEITQLRLRDAAVPTDAQSGLDRYYESRNHGVDWNEEFGLPTVVAEKFSAPFKKDTYDRVAGQIRAFAESGDARLQQPVGPGALTLEQWLQTRLVCVARKPQKQDELYALLQLTDTADEPTHEFRVAASKDGGATWSVAGGEGIRLKRNEAAPAFAGASFLVNRTADKKRTIVFNTGLSFDNTIYISEDDGVTWRALDTGLGFSRGILYSPNAWEVFSDSFSNAGGN